jgi:hypothetical protein
MPGATAGLRAEQAKLRERMRALGLGYEQIALEFGRRYRLRPRAAWRNAYGWSLSQAAGQINATAAALGVDRDGRASMSGPHLSEYEQWPGPGEEPTGRKPTPHLLALLAATYNAASLHDLLDVADYERLPPADLLVLERHRVPQPPAQTGTITRPGSLVQPVDGQVEAGLLTARQGDIADPPAVAAWLVAGGWQAQDITVSPLAARPVMAGLMGEPTGAVTGLGGWPGHDLVTATAHESSEQAAMVASRSLDEATLDQLRDDITRITRGYTMIPPIAAFVAARRLRDLGYRLLGNTRRPGQETDLYFAVGLACGLLAEASFDLGCWEAATAQARAAWVYGTQIGHPGLRAWAKGMLALLAFWSGDPATAVTLTEEAQRVAPPGTAMVRLRSIEARAWALQGQAREAERAIAHAESARERADGAEELHDQIGGQFGFDPARQARCNGSTYLQLGNATQASRRAEAAIGLCAAMPSGRRWVKIETQAHADLAAARLMGGDLDGARDALLPVLGTPSALRVEGLTRRVQRVADMLAAPAYRHSHPARQLSGEIGEFTSGALHRAIGS